MTKIFNPVMDDDSRPASVNDGPLLVNQMGLSRKHVFEAVDRCLERPQTDYIDSSPSPSAPTGEGSVRSQSDVKTKKWFADANLDIVDAVEKVAKEKGVSMALVTTAWVLRQGCWLIVGLSSEKRIKETIEALKVQLTDEECRFLEAGYRPRNIEGI
ncbi:alcohol dehydrogenase [Apiospora saccharicola]